MKTVKEIVEYYINNLDEYNKKACINGLALTIIEYAKKKCREQRGICSNLKFPDIDKIEYNDSIYIEQKYLFEDIENAPEPIFE